jgi:membrane protein
VHIRQTFAKFFADRGTHLAAMIAYFALLSFVPLLFLALALLGLSGRANESSYFVTELQKIFPGASISSIVAVIRTIQQNATSLGIIGGGFLLWSSLSLFSVLESAFNLVYDRHNRPFLQGKALAVIFMLASLVTLFAGLLIGSLGAHVLNRFASGFLGNTIVAYALSVLVSTIAVFLFIVSAYRYLTNTDLTVRDVLPGAIVATVGLEASFQVLPLYIGLSKHVPAAQAFGGPVLLLIWLYVMANVIVFGAEVNWMRSQRAQS